MFTTKKTLPPLTLLLHLAPDHKGDRLPETIGVAVSKSSDRSVFKVASCLLKVAVAVMPLEGNVLRLMKGFVHLLADELKMPVTGLSSRGSNSV